MIYCLDTSGILDGWKRHYPKEILPELVADMDALVSQRRIIIPEDVVKELKRHDDDAYRWAATHKSCHIPLTEEIQKFAKEVVLAQFPKLLAVSAGKSGGDPWLIATAKIHGAMVITGEHLGGPAHPKVPFVCERLGILYGGFIDILKREGWNFTRRATPHFRQVLEPRMAASQSDELPF
jgi:hypothetical protein